MNSLHSGIKMEMSSVRFRQLCDLGSQPHQSTRMQLIILRRACRQLLAERDNLSRAYSEAIKDAAKGLPFTQVKHQRLVAQRKTLQADYRQAIQGLGEQAIRMGREARGYWEFRHIADALVINSVHREEAKACYADNGLMGLLFMDRFEDSAVYRPRADKVGFWMDMGPLSRAVESYMIKWMVDNSEKLPDPFAPNGPLYGVPVYTMQEDGSMVRNAPPLTVLSPDGSSRVVGRLGDATK